MENETCLSKKLRVVSQSFCNAYYNKNDNYINSDETWDLKRQVQILQLLPS